MPPKAEGFLRKIPTMEQSQTSNQKGHPQNHSVRVKVCGITLGNLSV
jgi:hypothetical protein